MTTTSTATTRVWSEQQNAIFMFFEIGQGNAVVRARAGTGKTTTIIEGIRRAPEFNKLMCAFNKRIAEELNGRISDPRAKAQTLHSIGFQCVRRFWENVRVVSGSERADYLAEKVCGSRAPDAIKRLVAKLHTKGREIAPHARVMGDLTDLAYTFECTPDESWEGSGYDVAYIEARALEAMELAATVKPVQTGIDFADMIFLPVRNRWLTKTYDLVVVDEAQDMTVAQLEIAVGVCKGRIIVVGDDRQAIYGFRGADSSSLDRLKAELHATEFGLTVTYRCGKTIVHEANRLVSDFVAASTNGEGTIESITLEKLTDTAKHGDFILSRLNAPLVSAAMALLRSDKRARVAGRDIGAGLKALIKKLAKGRAANSVPELLSKLAAWESREIARLLAADKENQVDAIRDKVATLMMITNGADSVTHVEERIDSLFTDDGLGQAGVVTCSSVHRAKGLEAKRVFVLRDTLYPRGESIEEQNIEYVAITRAQETLVWVTKNGVVEHA
jgi:superfamily I DNA/RNA helicase